MKKGAVFWLIAISLAAIALFCTFVAALAGASIMVGVRLLVWFVVYGGLFCGCVALLGRACRKVCISIASVVREVDSEPHVDTKDAAIYVAGNFVFLTLCLAGCSAAFWGVHELFALIGW